MIETIILAVLGLAVAAAAIALVVVLRRTKKPASGSTISVGMPALPKADLVTIDGPVVGKRYRIGKPEITIGRDASCDIELREDGVSRRHGFVRYENGQFMLSDIGSQNGIWITGQRVWQTEIRPGEQFRIGETTLALVAHNQKPPEPLDHLANSPVVNEFGASLSGDYDELDKVGSGGQATVFRARSRRDGALVVIKYLNHLPVDSDGRYFTQKFEQQIAIGGTIRHPHCVKILGGNAKPEHDQPYLIEEYVSGGTLRERMDGNQLSAADKVRIIGQLCDALHYLHRRSIVHRDVKPSNVLFDENGDVKLTDFGLARVVGHATRTKAGMRIGTPHYMSVEQARGDSGSISPQSDLYSLGVIAYELFTGALPFDGTDLDILNQHLSAKPRAPKDVKRDVPEEINRAILKAMEKDPKRRPADALELARAFGYSQPFKTGDLITSVSGVAGRLRLQNTKSGMLLPINVTPRALTREEVNPLDKGISRRHGQVFNRDGIWYVAEIADAPSANGIYWNGVRVIDPQPLIAGDEIRLSATTLRVLD